MLKKQFEHFLGEHFIQWAFDRVEPGHRYQFKSPDSERSLQLYQALCGSSSSTRSIKDVEVAAIRLNNADIIPVFHDEGENGFSENFISMLRDGISSQKGELGGCALLIIHDSMLDTLNNSAQDIAQEGLAWHPKQIKDLLHTQIDQNDANAKISECLLDFQFDEVITEGATMFGFEPLYDAISDGDLLFREVGLLKDETILDFDDPAQIKQRLLENKELCEKIEFLVHHFPTELPEKLALEDLSDGFVDKYFPADDVENYKESLTLGKVQAEQAKNRTNLLELEKVTALSGDLIQKSKSEKGAGLREKHLILILDENKIQFEIEATFLAGKVQKSHCKIQHNKGFPDVSLSVKNAGGIRSRVVLNSMFTGEARMFSLQVKTDKPKETHKFRVLVIQRDDFFIDGFRNNYLIEPNKSWVTLQTDESTLRISNLSCKTDVNNNLQEFSVEQTGVVDFKQIISKSDDVCFSVKGKFSTLIFNVEGEVATDSLHLPLLLDRTRNNLLFTDSYYGLFNSSKNKVLIDGKEVAPKGRRLTLLQYEEHLLRSATLAIDRNAEPLYISDIRDQFSGLYNSYRELFDWLENRKTLLSLEGWGTKLRSLVDNVAVEYLTALNNIPLNSPLNHQNRKLLAIGFAHLGEQDNQQEFMTPYHPLVLAYNSFLTNELARDKNGSASFKTLPKVTIQRLTAQGLLPFLYSDIYEFSYNLTEKENPLWSKIVTQKDSSYDFVRTLVKDKTGKFVAAFKSLFSNGEKSQLIINSVNNQHNRELFLGLVDYVRANKGQVPSIHVNLYDNHESKSWFDVFSETASYEQLKEICDLNKGPSKDRADSIIDLLRTRLTYSKYQHDSGKIEQKYAHISFFKNNERVHSTDVNVSEQQSGVVSSGLMPGEAASNKNGSYFTAFGLKDVDVSQSIHLQLAQKVNGLIKSAVCKHEVHGEAKSQALVVTDNFRELLEISYQNSIWTTIIDPKVTLDFFESQKDVVLIHYSDSYTNSVNYDAIIVTKQTDLYQKVLENDNGGVIEEFNAFNGEWLLNMVTASANERKEKRGIIGAYKYINCLLISSPITWVPISIAEIIRVAGNLGLKMSESDFSRYAQKIKKGVISDDILFAGFYEDKLILLPVEVKTGKRQTHSKGVEQAKELKRYFTELLGQKTLAGHLYRGLFIRQVLMQIDKYQLYNVYEPDYFNPILDRSAWWLDGNYELAEIQNYPDGFLLVNVEDESFSTATFTSIQSILKIELPAGSLNTWVNTKLGNLFNEITSSKLHNIPSHYILEKKICLKTVDAKTNFIEQNAQIGFVSEELEEHNVNTADEPQSVKHGQVNDAAKNGSQRKKMNDDDLQNIYQAIIDCYYSYGISVLVPADGEKFVEGPASIMFRVEISAGTDPKKLFDKSQALKLTLKLDQEQEIGFAIDKGAVTIDVPKAPDQRYFVDQSDIWAPNWSRPEHALEVPIGEDRHGMVIPLNFSSSNCPHLLIGGTTGSGKSEALNTILYGMVEHYKSTELKLMLIDPKGTELTDFEGYPHLIGEIGWDDQDALELLTRAVDEMQTRYALFKQQKVRSLPDYNANVAENERIPWWVLVLDEYADLTSDKEMKKDIEGELKRLAQKARAAGIHLVIATQKPSADVISTNLRSNLPAQLALRVKNGTESRVIIDEQGAEVLNGKGDAYLKSEGKLVRIQCAKISET